MGSGFFALLDDIATLMDDVAAMSKISTRKTAGILGDDLAVNAEKASGFVSSRELPVLWAITKGSFLNKIIILPLAFLLSAFWPPAIKFILVLGGLYLAYEGAEKIYEFIFHHNHESKTSTNSAQAIIAPSREKQKIKSAVFTDFILSVEIVIIALGTVLEQPLLTQILVVSIVALVATIGVYGIVALIVRMDDLGLYLIKHSHDKSTILSYIGHFLVKALPVVIKSLSVIGTVALILVAGGIFNHNIEWLHDILHDWPTFVKDFVVGLLVGIAILLVVLILKYIYKKIN